MKRTQIIQNKASKSIPSSNKQSRSQETLLRQKCDFKIFSKYQGIVDINQKNPFNSDQEKLFQNDNIMIYFDQFIIKNEGVSDIFKIFQKILDLQKNHQFHIVFNQTDGHINFIKTLLKNGYKSETFIIVLDINFTQNCFKSVKELRKNLGVQLMIDLDQLNGLQFENSIQFFMNQIQKNKKYVNIVYFADHYELNDLKHLFDISKLKNFVNTLFFFIDNFQQFGFQIVNKYRDSGSNQSKNILNIPQLIHQYKQRELDLQSNIQVIYLLILEIVMQNEKFIQYIFSQQGNNDYLFEDIRNEYKTLNSYFHILAEIQSKVSDGNLFLFNDIWEKNNVPFGIIPYLLAGYLGQIQQYFKQYISKSSNNRQIKNSEQKSRSLKTLKQRINNTQSNISYKSKQLQHLKCLIYYRRSLKELQTLYLSGNMKLKCNEYIRYNFTLQQLKPIIQIINIITLNTTDRVKTTVKHNKQEPIIEYELCGSMRRGRVININNINIIIHEKNSKYLVKRLNLYRKEYGILIYTNSGFINFSIKHKNIQVKVNVQLYNDTNYGLIKLFETGNVPFNYLVIRMLGNKKMEIFNNQVRYIQTGQIYPLESEESLFKLLGLKYIPPEYRTANNISHIWKLNGSSHPQPKRSL